MEDGSRDHLPVQLRPEGRIDAALEKECEGHQVKGDRLDGPRIIVTGMLDSVGVDDELVEPHALWVGVLGRQQLAVAPPARRGSEHVGVSGAGLRRQRDPASGADLNRLGHVERLPASLPFSCRDKAESDAGGGTRTPDTRIMIPLL
jgi:hypothetical protein